MWLSCERTSPVGTGGDISALTDPRLPRSAEPARPLVGRDALLATVRSHLDLGRPVLLTGPSGIGKSALLTALGAAPLPDDRVLRIGGSDSERWISWSAAADLLGRLPSARTADLAYAHRAAVDAILLRNGARASSPEPAAGLGGRGPEPDPHAARLALHELLHRHLRAGPALLLVDDLTRVDAESAALVAYAVRRLAAAGLGCVCTAPPGARPLPGGVEVPVPALSSEQLADLLAPFALPARAANTVHADSGGNPYLALSLAAAVTDRPEGSRPVGGPRPTPLPPALQAVIAQRLGELPERARATLLTAALAADPAVDLLERAGHDAAEQDVATASAAGLLVLVHGGIRFTPPAVAAVLVHTADAERRARSHRALATAVPHASGRVRHEALASPERTQGRSLAAAAETALRSGARALAAELFLLAADRTSTAEARERFEWCAAAAEAGAAESLPEIVHRAADTVLAGESHRAQRVRVRLALADLSSQALACMDETLAGALEDAQGDAALTARVRLRLAWARMVGGDTPGSQDEAVAAAGLARSVADRGTEALALTVQAVNHRVTGRPDAARRALAAALAPPAPVPEGLLPLSPRFYAARFAFFDDRLTAARTELLRMLSQVERGRGDELVLVLRCLAEVCARMGRCRDALHYAHRAGRVARECGTSPGPTWYTRAVAELAGGSLSRATAYAERGVRASEQEQDAIHLGRCLHVLGQAQLLAGDPAKAVRNLERVRAGERRRGLTAPLVLRWHGDLALGLARLGRTAEAAEVIAEARAALAREAAPEGAVAAQLLRAEALATAVEGDPQRATELLGTARRRFAVLGQPLEEAQCLLLVSRLERRRRRRAAAQRAAEEARELLAACAAGPWTEEAEGAVRRCETGGGRGTAAAPPSGAAGGLAGLTEAETRIAVLVGAGASNREVAARLFLSAKTVEGTLTRIYRKLGVRSRTQLCSLVSGRPHAAPTPPG
ncbi:LuxR family transcriptional regulator [Streptomyces sp. WMMC1477]|uniref:LuxR family transcriptional regulator n=1 Tax=Streptomyces sp. WMMC1477 TaxID=3015155 RepID=UPI002FC3C528